jgi:hypothetical protein
MDRGSFRVTLYIENSAAPSNLENRLEDAAEEHKGPFDTLYLGYMTL